MAPLNNSTPKASMHTLKVIAAGFALLVVCLLLGRWLGGPTPDAGLVQAAKIFIPLWFIGAAVNMWLGVTSAGYSIAEEAPVFLIVFAVPVVVALVIWWRYSKG